MRWLWVLALVLTGCYRDHLYVQQEWVDGNFLASSKIGTPDPQQANPPTGQRLLIAWYFPDDLFAQNLTLHITVRLWDNTEQKTALPVTNKWSHTALFFPWTNGEKKILTYQILVMAQDGHIIETWNHPLWTELIQIGQ